MFFTWEGFDEMDEVRGTGSAELQDDVTLEIEVAYHLGATLKAERPTTSTACQRLEGARRWWRYTRCVPAGSARPYLRPRATDIKSRSAHPNPRAGFGRGRSRTGSRRA